jgi:hypothetical protein
VSTDTVDRLPVLTFQLLGTWNRIDLTTEETLAQTVREYVDERLGTADAEAQARSLLRSRLSTAMTIARDAGAVTSLIATEIAPGTPMPVMLTIYSPQDLRMTPAVGTAPDAVATMLRKGLTQLEVEGIDDATSLSIEGSEIMRIVREQVDPIHPDLPAQELTSLLVDYWYTVPGSKHVVLANFATPLADIPNVMLSYFDATVRASYFARV